MWRWDGLRLSWLICLPELAEGHKADGWKPIGTMGGPSEEQIAEVRQADEDRWAPVDQRRSRWRKMRRERRLGSSGE